MYVVMYTQGCWGPAMDLYKVLVAIRQLLAEPNPKDPLMVDIVSMAHACQPSSAQLAGKHMKTQSLHDAHSHKDQMVPASSQCAAVQCQTARLHQ